VATERSKQTRLLALAALIDSHADWWRFPADEPVRGFLGTDPLFIVGDQPSTSSWGPLHPNRQFFYGLLTKLGAANAHLTDLYKVRGRPGSLKAGLPADFGVHLRIFRQELEIIKPARVVALGEDAYRLMNMHVPELRGILRQIWHFAYAAGYGRRRIDDWETNASVAFFGDAAAGPVTRSAPVASVREMRTSHQMRPASRAPRSGTQRDLMRALFQRYAGDPELIISAYAAAERKGEAPRASNNSGLRPEEYARALLNDGLRKGWVRRG
jgi:hypothetical protein